MFTAIRQDPFRPWGIDTSKYDGRRHFVAYWWFTSWAEISFGLHVSLAQPNIEIHLPFGFVRIGWTLCPVWPVAMTPEERAHDALDQYVSTIKTAVTAALLSEPCRDPYREAIRDVERAKTELLQALDTVRDAAIAVRDLGPYVRS